MYQEFYGVETPEDSFKIWRYMDFTKFVSLLKERALFFSFYKEFDDPFEGNFPFGIIQSVSLTIKEVNAMSVDKSYYSRYITDEEALDLAKEQFQKVKKTIDKRPHIINCWHQSDYESTAMWNLYSGLDKGIAIQTTIGKLKECFHGYKQDVAIGKVEYLDFGEDTINWGYLFYTYRLFLYKRLSFEHEKEIRAIISVSRKKIDQNLKGDYIPVDLEILIENIYVSPKAKDWFRDLVEETAKKYNMEINVLKSKLNEAPAYLK